MTAGLLISRRRKLELYKTYLACRTELNFAVYKNYNRFNRLIRASKVSYYESQLKLNQKDPKIVWKILNESLNRVSNKSSLMREISVDGKLITEPIEIANSFNTFFSEIAKNIRAKIPFTSVNPNSYARGKNLDFNLSNIDHLYFKNIITSLETKTSLDIDDLNTKVL